MIRGWFVNQQTEIRDNLTDASFNLAVNLALLLDESLLPSAVNHTFLYLYPRDR